MAIDEDKSGLLEDSEELDLDALNECKACEITYMDDLTAEPETTPIYDEEHGKHGFVEGVKNGCTKCTIKQRLKSKTVWAGILAQLAVIADMVYKIAAVGWDISLGEGIVFALLEIVTLFGVFNNPTDREDF